MRKNMHSRITVNEQTIEDLREELGPDTWFCSFHDFKARLLPGSLAPEKVQAIRKNLEEKGILTVGKGFRSYPVEPDGSGPDYYIPFRDAANAIQHDPLLRDVTRKQPSEPGFQSTWVTTNNQPLQSIEPKASKSRPDISCMVSSGLSKDHIAEKIAKELDHWEDQAMRENRKRKRQAEETDTGLPASVATMSTPAAGAGMTDTASEPERNPGARSEEELMWYQWLMSVMVVEIEPTDPSTYEVTSDIIFQEAKHMKHILQEQHDRRFVFGIIIFHNKMTLWYCDRAGLLGTYDAINIQTDPDAFIEVMALFAIMSPFEHGWDESMKLLIFNSIPDSDGTLEVSKLPKTRDQLRWQVTAGDKVFWTLETISAVGTEDLCGSATIVWLAVCANDPDQHNQLFVIKQSWRPVVNGLRSEYDIYVHAELKDRIELLQSPPNGFNTGDRREGFALKGPQEVSGQMQYYYTSQRIQEPVEERRGLHDVFEGSSFLDSWARSRMREVVSRELTRTASSIFGSPIHYFKDLKEVLQAFLDILVDYEDLYSKNICHGDISPGNIIIAHEATAHGKTGVLVDLEHAKVGESAPVRIRDKIKDPDFEKELTRLERHWNIIVEHKLVPPIGRLPLAALLAAWDCDAPAALCELNKWVDHNKPPGNEQLECKHFSVEITEDTFAAPYFSKYAKYGSHSGKPAFTSHAMLPDEPSDAHRAIHDMESLAHVLLYICITRSGPGGQRHDAHLTEKDNGSHNTQSSTVSTGTAVRQPSMGSGSGTHPLVTDGRSPQGSAYDTWLREERTKCARRNHMAALLFENAPANIQAAKTILVNTEDRVPNYVVPFFSPYFEPLQDLVKEWWELIRSAFGPVLIGRDPVRNPLLYHYPIPTFRKLLMDFLPRVESYKPTLEGVLTPEDVEATRIQRHKMLEDETKAYIAMYARM